MTGFTHTISFDRSSYGCSNEIVLEVTDVNHPASSMTVTIWSDSETTPETVTLTETSTGSALFTGSIFTTTAPAGADGQLTFADGDSIVAEYVDLDDGMGGINVPTQSTVPGDCVRPVISGTTEIEVSETAATVTWQERRHLDWDIIHKGATFRTKVAHQQPPIHFLDLAVQIAHSLVERMYLRLWTATDQHRESSEFDPPFRRR